MSSSLSGTFIPQHHTGAAIASRSGVKELMHVIAQNEMMSFDLSKPEVVI